MTEETIVRALESQGYKLTELPEFGYSFTCEDLNIVLFLSEDNPNIFHLVLPQIYECTVEDRQKVLELVNHVNGEYSFVKLVLKDADVWAFTDAYVDDSQELTEITERCIRVLISAHMAFYMQAIDQGLVCFDDETNDDDTQLFS